MKNVISKLVICVFTAGLFLSPSMQVFAADSGIGDNMFSIGPRMTLSTPKDADSGQWSAGAQARLHLSPSMGLEGSIDYRSNIFFNLTTVKTYPVQLSLLAYLMPSAVMSPYLLGGVGFYYTQVAGPFNFSNTNYRFGLHAGAGLELMLNEALSLDGSYRYVFLENVASKDVNALDKTYQDSGSMITIALNFLF